jgi:hypothetical protein
LGKLDAALAWAARGFRVFPLQINSKNPTDLGWTVHATTDPKVIRTWWTDPILGAERDNNIGFLCTGWIVPDVDVKDGKPGLDTFFRLDMDFDTLTTRTPTGGYHLIYQGGDALVGGSPLGEGIDIRSHNGYVVAPGSTIDGVPYVVEIDIPVAPFPAHLRGLLRAPRRKLESPGLDIDLDTPELVEVVAHWLAYDAPPAIEGANGDDTTYRVACRIRDFGLSEQVAYELFVDEYNSRCSPPWSVSEARAKIENAYRYATGEIGSMSPAAVFGDIHIVPPPAPASVVAAAALLSDSVYRFGNMMDVADIEARPWIFGDILMARAVTALIAAGGAGKSLFTLTLAAHLAVGKPFLGYPVHRSGKSIIVNAEDDLAEQSRRLNAICEVYELDRDHVRSCVSLVGAEDAFALKVTTGHPPIINDLHVAALIAAASDPDVVLISVDPLVDVHTASENLADEMAYVMSIFRMIARRTECALLVIHHTAKPPAANSSAWVGDANAGRGSTSLPNATRTTLTLFPASEEDSLEIGIPPAERKSYVRLDDGKKSYSARRGSPLWLKWQALGLQNGDSVGVLVPHDATKAYDHAAQDIADRLREHMMRHGLASLLIDEAVSVLSQSDPLAERENRDVVKTRLVRLLSKPITSEGVTVQIITDLESGKKIARVVLH